MLRDGYELWKSKVNADGGIKVGDKTYTVEVIYYDDESRAETSARLTEKLVTGDKVSFLLGPFSSGIGTATAVISDRYNTLRSRRWRAGCSTRGCCSGRCRENDRRTRAG